MLTKNDLDPKGIIVQITNERASEITGAKIKLEVFVFAGITVSFNINLKASATGCNKPLKPTKSGPFLCWIDPIIFRSANVKNATETKTGKTKPIKEINFSKRKNCIKIYFNYTKYL